MEWLGIDSKGYLARFTTAGRGWMPRNLNNYSVEYIFNELEFMDNLPSVSDSEFTDAKHACRDFEICCQKGVFIYDWTSVHGRTPQNENAYELVAIPTNPILASSVIPNMASLIGVEFNGIEFLGTRYITENK